MIGLTQIALALVAVGTNLVAGPPSRDEVLYALMGPDLRVFDLTGAERYRTPQRIPGFTAKLSGDATGLYSLRSSAGQFATLYRLHPASAAGVAVGPALGPYTAVDIAHDPISGQFFLVGASFSFASVLYSANSTNGALSAIAPITGAANYLWSIGVDPMGNAYASNGNQVYSLDLTSGVTQLVGTLSVQLGILDMAFDSTGTLWAVLWDNPGNEDGIYKIDLATLTATKMIAGQSAGITFGMACLPEAYCSGKTNTLGCDPILEYEGQGSVTAGDGFWIRARNVRNARPGILLSSVNGRANLPFHGGTLCIAPPLKRSGVVSSGGSHPFFSDCTGVWALDFNAFLPTQFAASWDSWPPYVPLPPGTRYNVQWWGRDAPGVSALSAGMEFELCP